MKKFVIVDNTASNGRIYIGQFDENVSNIDTAERWETEAEAKAYAKKIDPEETWAFVTEIKEPRYLHFMTGSVDTREGWISSYPAEELENHNLTAEEAFDKDVEDECLVELPE